jgi:hypothetical protein
VRVNSVACYVPRALTSTTVPTGGCKVPRRPEASCQASTNVEWGRVRSEQDEEELSKVIRWRWATTETRISIVLFFCSIPYLLHILSR